MPDYALIPLTPYHAEEMASIHYESLATQWDAPSYTRVLESEQHLGLGVDQQGQLLGFLVCQFAADEAEILDLAVRTSARRQGVASLLLTTAATRLHLQGIREMFLEVAHNNAAARGFYASLGFSEVGRRADYYVTDAGLDDAIRLRKILLP